MSSSSVEHRHGIGGTATAAKRILLFPLFQPIQIRSKCTGVDGYKLYLKNCYKCVNTSREFFCKR